MRCVATGPVGMSPTRICRRSSAWQQLAPWARTQRARRSRSISDGSTPATRRSSEPKPRRRRRSPRRSNGRLARRGRTNCPGPSTGPSSSSRPAGSAGKLYCWASCGGSCRKSAPARNLTVHAGAVAFSPVVAIASSLGREWIAAVARIALTDTAGAPVRKNSPPSSWLLTIWRPQLIVSCCMSKRALAHCAPGRVTSHPPFGLGTTCRSLSLGIAAFRSVVAASAEPKRSRSRAPRRSDAYSSSAPGMAPVTRWEPCQVSLARRAQLHRRSSRFGRGGRKQEPRQVSSATARNRAENVSIEHA